MPKVHEINKSLGELEEELKKVKTANEMVSITQKAADVIIKESKELNKTTKQLKSSAEKLMKKLDKVDFPTRLDKLDTTVSGINSGIQNVLSRFDSIERNLKDDFDDKISRLKDKLEKAVRINIYLTLGMLIVLSGAFIALFYKMGFLGQ